MVHPLLRKILDPPLNPVVYSVYCNSGGVCGRVVNSSNSGSGGPGFKPLPVALFPYTRNFTLLGLSSLRLYKWVPATYYWGVTCDGLASHPGGVAILLSMLHANESGISSGRLGLWLMCAFTFMPYIVSQQNGLSPGVKYDHPGECSAE